jgi:predicted flap endonuclease-1-like 5' DNA nuclease
VNDLDKLKGIGPKHKEMLKSIGIDSIKELRHRNPAHLKHKAYQE